MQDFRKLRVYQQSRVVLRLTYQVTASFPVDEKFNATAQMRSAAFALGSNIAEGCGRSSYAAFRVALDRTSGEGSELESQCVSAQDLAFGTATEVEELLTETVRFRKMLARLIIVTRMKQAERKRGDEGLPR